MKKKDKQPSVLPDWQYFIDPLNATANNALYDFCEKKGCSLSDLMSINVKGTKEKHRVYSFSLENLQRFANDLVANDWLKFKAFKRSHPDRDAVEVSMEKLRRNRVAKSADKKLGQDLKKLKERNKASQN